MKEIILYGITSGLFFLIFIIFFLIAIVKKRNWFYLYGVTFLFISLASFFITINKVSSKTYNRVDQSINAISNQYGDMKSSLRDLSSVFEPRTGEEIYTTLFNDSIADCVKINRFQDQVVPKIDYAILLHFQTCNDEVRRILKLRTFKPNKVLSSNINDSMSEWFLPNSFNDSVLVFTSLDEYGNGQVLYVNSDSTEVYCKDILD